ncbi:MAG: hypothetical protein JNL10_06835 [Verrucomicrobiales bacterium]|nr:hypothetical protein [Verrucomicrobiales bacterium]
MKSSKLVLCVLLLFTAGMVTGGAAVRLRDRVRTRNLNQIRGDVPNSVWQRVEFFRKAQRDLSLDREQRNRIESHLRESQENVRQLWAPVAPKVRAEMDSLRDRIRTELTPEQQARFDQVLLERRKSGKRVDRPEGSGRPGEAPTPGHRSREGVPRPESPPQPR